MKNIIKNIIAWKLKVLVTWLLAKKQMTIIGVTGSMGKSSTKEAIFHVLNNYINYLNKVKKSYGNLNTEIGLPLSILGFNKAPYFYQWPFVMLVAYLRIIIFWLDPLSQTSILVLEYAADKPGDISYLADFIKPNIAVITNIGPAHLINYNSIDEIAEEKAQLVYSLPKDGLAILEKSSKYTDKISKNIKSEIKYFNNYSKGAAFEIAQIVGERFGISKKESEKILSTYKPMNHRLNIININGLHIIDDTYNANPLSVKLAIEELSIKAEELKTKRKIIVLGDMLELGKEEKKYHEEIGKLAKKSTDMLITIGPLSKIMNGDYWFENRSQAERFILNTVKKDDIILFKASRKIGLDKLVEKIIKS